MNPRRPSIPCPRAPGFVLLTVLVIVMLSSMLAASVLYAMRSEATAHAASVQQEQAWRTAMCGVARAMLFVTGPEAAGVLWRDNPAAFQHQFVVQDGDDQWYFTVYTASESVGAEIRFGLTDESAKLSLQHSETAWLTRLPSLDEDTIRTLTGALSGTDGSPSTDISPAPSAANDASSDRPASGNLERTSQVSATRTSSPTPSLEELFARTGLDPRLLFGEDANYNLRLDANEDDLESRAPLDDGNGQLNPGLQQHLTTVSYELNLDGRGRPRVNLNDPNADLSRCGLPQSALDYLAAMQRAGQSLPHVSALLEAEAEFNDDQGRPVRLRSGIGRNELANLLDQCTATNATRFEGLININTASREVLAAIPAIGEALADTIVATRVGLGGEEAQTPAWLYQRGVVSADEFKQIVPHVTTRSYQFSFRCVGYALPSGRYRALAATLDAAVQPPRVLALRDLTRFGFPVPLDILQSGSSDGASAGSSPHGLPGVHVAWR